MKWREERTHSRLRGKIARPNAVVVVVAMYEEPQMLPLPDMYGKNLVFKTGGVGRQLLSGDYGSDLHAGSSTRDSLLLTGAGLDQIMEAYDVFENRKIMS